MSDSDTVKVKQGNDELVLPLLADDTLAVGVAAIPAVKISGKEMTFGSGHGDIELERNEC